MISILASLFLEHTVFNFTKVSSIQQLLLQSAAEVRLCYDDDDTDDDDDG